MDDIVLATKDFRWNFENAFHQTIPVLYDDIFKIREAKLIIFSGGADINPEIYNQENTYSFVDYKRDSVELKILNWALKMNKKILGVCRGHQLINAYLGGDLVQDLHKNLNVRHRGDHKLIYLTEDSLIKSLFHKVNSLHHQGVIKAGEGLIPTSEFKGVFESCESKNIITVQFHPEFMLWKPETIKFFNYIRSWKES